MKIARSIVAAVAALTVSLGVAACGSSTVNAPAADSNAAASQISDAVISVNSVEPSSSLLPGNTNDMAGWKIVTQLFEGLVTFSDTGDLEYVGAESITPNADASEYTIKLKPDVKFSNGEVITASTYARSWSFAANAANGQMGASIFASIKGYDDIQDENGDKNKQLSGLTVVDDTTLKVTLKAPDSSFPYKTGDVAFLPLPSVAYDDIDAFGQHPIGNGPYLFESWTPNQSIVLKRNPDYTGSNPAKNAGLEFRVYTDTSAAYSDVLSGNLDLLDSIPDTALKTFKTDEGINAFSQPGPGFTSLTIPQNLAHFTGEEGALRRKAISLAIDRDNVASKILQGTVTPATDFTAPAITGYSKDLDTEHVIAYDEARAKELWAQADAISPWSGSFRIAYAADSGNKTWIDAVANSVKNVLGIDAEGYAFPISKDYSSAVRSRTVNAAFKSGLQSDYPHPEGYLVQAYASWAADGKGLNNGDYKSDAFDALINKAAEQTDLTKAVDYYHQAEQLLLKDLPVIPLWYSNLNAVTPKATKNVSFNYMAVAKYTQLTK